MLRHLVLLIAGPAIGLAVPAPAHATVPVPPAPPAAAPATATVTPTAVAPRTLMSQVVTMTNQRRWANGCRRLLTVDRELVVASVRQSVYMARTGLFSHVWRDGTTFVRRSHLAGYEQPSGENIAWGYRTATEVVEAWMASPRHRANMLNCGAKSIGTGVVYAANGVPYYTQVFGWD
ncbi:CAP domain-containing protein [Paractinoplanes lichenicola]|uniref:CAP domain-containing protein n=1 Tax=Paractinoplanes lichenicola TaxID=2802976 RepID=A0ABS1VLF5_9ACTN|nr:CAP domain-containing protein [Actinoplanes lichenicola]MBL7254607.1 CAP domain-containing protein [Actinoplanes lichenicola]